MVSAESLQAREPAAADAGRLPAAPLDDSGKRSMEVQGQIRTTRSGQKTKPITRFLTIMAAKIHELTSGDVEGEIFCYRAMFPKGDEQEYNDPLFAYKAGSDPDTLYNHDEAMKQEDRKEFLKGMKKKSRINLKMETSS